VAKFIPIDALAIKYIGKDKEISEGPLGELKDGAFTALDELKKITTGVFNSLVADWKNHKTGDDKENGVNGKYKSSEVCT